ncbi:type VI secretion protein [Leucobacter sp. UCD-THU]|uniref:type IV secretory system conjugative DNA transfer family protein n=1 Tax=Leucobacter sp. UCD-THU TaxID=1292023 RepID=UPI00036C6A50|nr:TraM recognition domain-containing protein [Leucobacter sp. UCD-THU]EYT56576.1 type VI secretion protein [Leucobacter sp. UCD-THU]
MTASSPRPVNDHLVNVSLGLLAVMAALSGLLRLAATIAAWLVGTPRPRAGMLAGLAAVVDPLHPARALEAPGLNAPLYWTIAVVLLTVVSVPAVWAVMKWFGRSTRPNIRRIAGTATGGEIAAAASAKQLLRRASTLRPSLPRGSAKPSDVGYFLGRARGHDVWATVEDSILLIGPPRSGKGRFVAVNAILDAPGSCIVTSTRPDNLTITLEARRKIGPVAVFDPQNLAPGLPSGLRWSPVRGCRDPQVAMIRAAGLAASSGFGDVEGGGFWEGKTRAAIQAMLHAAAIDGRDARTLYQWALSPTAAMDAVRVLQGSAEAAEGWADSLESMATSDPRTRDSIWQGVGLAFQSLADPRVLDAVCPDEDEAFDPETFIAARGTLYLLATGAGSSSSAALVAALIEDIVEVARRMAARGPGARLDPPLLMCLDEIGNLAPLPSLPVLMAEGGGTGITPLPVLQSLAQAREKWGENAAQAIWDASIVKIVLGGGSNTRDLQDLSALFGERDEDTDAVTADQYGGRSLQRSIRRVPILPADLIRSLPFGTGAIVLRSARPIIANLRSWTDRTESRELQNARAEIENQIRAAQ